MSGQDMNRVTFSVVAIMLLAAATTLPFVLNAGFGKAPQGAQLSQVEASPHYRDGQFHNQLPTPGFTGQKNMLAAWWDFLMTKRENARPAQPLPLVKTDLATLPLGQDVMVWLGHSSWYLQLAGKRILIDPVFSDYAAPFDAECQQAIADAAQRLGYPARPIVSGAGHDAVYMSYLAPTGMIFIPCKDGISHNEIEYASPEHVAAGANVLLQVMLQYARPV
ncbi:M20/M25/M40 family metallo-hydrolase [Klebsiella pneumoniae]